MAQTTHDELTPGQSDMEACREDNCVACLRTSGKRKHTCGKRRTAQLQTLAQPREGRMERRQRTGQAPIVAV
eukprot:2639233-Prymnesium_polylepis.1